MRDPLGRLFPGLPRGVRVVLDWVLTIAGAIVIVFGLKMWVVNPYRIPSSSMEPTLHCAKPAPGCEAQFSDRVLANRFIYHFRNPKRGEIIVFNTPPEAKIRCGAGGTFVKRLIGLPGETVSERDGIVYINGASSRSRTSARPARPRAAAHVAEDPEGLLLLHGRQPGPVLRLAGLGARAPQEPDRRGVLRLLAAEPDWVFANLAPRPAGPLSI